MALITSILAIIMALTHILPALAQAPLPPTIDPFYQPDDDSWKTLDPGEILKNRSITLPSIFPGTESPLTAHQLLFVTRNGSNHPTTSVTTVIRPQNANPKRLLSYQIAYDSPDVNCSPSFGLRKGAHKNAKAWNFGQLTLILPYLMSNNGPLGKRPFINIPDYEGNNAAFTVGPQSGYHTLDSIKAALNSQKYTGIDPTARAVMFGYSGGGLASEWASELHAHHAPDLNIVGAAIGGPPPNVTNTYIHVNGTQSPLNIWAILGVMNAFPEVDECLRRELDAKYGSFFLGPLARCSESDITPPKIPTDANVSSWFENGDRFLYEFSDILNDYGVMGKYIEKDKAPKFPLYIYQGTNDSITAPISDTDALYKKYCDEGTVVRYVRYHWKDHGQTLLRGMYPAWTWISARFNGAFPGLKCSIKDVRKDDDGDDDGDDGGEDGYSGLGWLGDALGEELEQDSLAQGVGDLK
ncbi:secretory lipase-domain-containing protein [Aspergillus pseudodeflectus]|uniref:Secretory lipase-domain-containing protein n=1 Tax=Aspergillus pseudodeflectus TaxID=176178 RepID=A0ABR4JPR3_9EURO